MTRTRSVVKSTCLAYLISGFATTGVMAFEDDIMKDPYVILFKAKLDEATSEVRAMEANTLLAETRYKAALDLISKGAMSRDEFNQTYATLKATEAQLDVARHREKARKAMLDVVILNRLAGKEVQQCN